MADRKSKQSADVLRELGRLARERDGGRSGGRGAGPPISRYDDLTAAQITARLAALSVAELRRVRAYERRHAKRRTVLGAVERRLA